MTAYSLNAPSLLSPSESVARTFPIMGVIGFRRPEIKVLSCCEIVV